jgi:hypothetical protein
MIHGTKGHSTKGHSTKKLRNNSKINFEKNFDIANTHKNRVCCASLRQKIWRWRR